MNINFLFLPLLIFDDVLLWYHISLLPPIEANFAKRQTKMCKILVLFKLRLAIASGLFTKIAAIYLQILTKNFVNYNDLLKNYKP